MHPSKGGTKDLIQRAADGVREWHPTVLVVVGTILMAGWNHEAAFWFGAVVFLAGTVLSVRRQRAYETLREAYTTLERQSNEVASASKAALDRRDAVISALSCCELAFLGQQLKYYSSERITLFRPAPGGFTLVARWSMHPRYRASGREFYPLCEGCLGEAWNWGFAAEIGLPDPKSALEEWLAVSKTKWHIPRQTAQEFTMKSRTYVAIRLEGGTGREPLGVIVFESERTTADLVGDTSPVLDLTKLKKQMKGASGLRLQAVLEHLSTIPK